MASKESDLRYELKHVRLQSDVEIDEEDLRKHMLATIPNVKGIRISKVCKGVDVFFYTNSHSIVKGGVFGQWLYDNRLKRLNESIKSKI
jgi:hypothetical protein